MNMKLLLLLRKNLVALIAVFCIAIFSYTPTATANPMCNASLNTQAMTELWLNDAARTVATRRPSVAILPFAPVLSHSEVPPSLPYAFPILLGDYWPATGTRAISDWRLTSHVMRQLGFTTLQAFDDQTALAVGERLQVSYVISGAFDLYQDHIRVYVRFYDVAAKRRLNPAGLALRAQLDASFPAMIGDIALGSTRVIPQLGVDQASVKALRYSTARFDAIRDYVEGVTHTSVYDAGELSVAKVWLKNAIGKDYRFHQAYRELARANLMLALMTKERLMQPGPESFEADRALQDADLHARGTPLRPREQLMRYITSRNDFALGVTAFNRGDLTRAIPLFQNVQMMLPEDGLNQHYLGLALRRANTSVNGAQAEAAFRAARAVNPCFSQAIGE